MNFKKITTLFLITFIIFFQLPYVVSAAPTVDDYHFDLSQIQSLAVSAGSGEYFCLSEIYESGKCWFYYFTVPKHSDTQHPYMIKQGNGYYRAIIFDSSNNTHYEIGPLLGNSTCYYVFKESLTATQILTTLNNYSGNLGSPDVMKYSNIPYFNTNESAASYFLTGDTSGMLNSEYLLPQFDESIPLPGSVEFNSQRLHSELSANVDRDGQTDISPPIQVSWQNNSDIDYFVEMAWDGDFDYRSGMFWWESDSEAFTVKDYIFNKQLSSSFKYCTFNEKFYITLKGLDVPDQRVIIRNLTFKIRFVNEKGDYGNWVFCQIFRDGEWLGSAGPISVNVGDKPNQNYNGGYGVIDSSGNAVDDDNYNINYKPTVDTFGYSDIITSGFYVFGDNGLFSLLGTCFNWIPGPVLATINLGVAMVFVAIVYKLIRG